MTDLDDAFDAVPVAVYTHHERYGETVHRSQPESIRRELAALQVRAGDRVLEIGTGSGYSGAILAELCGPRGRVTSIDISDDLVRRATAIHAERGVTGVDCHVADGLAGYPAREPYHRAVAWCAPPRLPRTWTEQVVDGGRIVACLPIARLPSTTLIATITVEAGQPRVEAVTDGGYAQSTTTAVDDALTVPGRWVDWCDNQPDPSWIAIGWRADDDAQRTGARSALDQLLRPGHTEIYRRQPLDWRSWHTFAAALGDPHLSFTSLRNQIRGLGHTTATSAAVIMTDATLVADSPDSPSLSVLRGWLDRWERAGRPAVDAFTTALVPHQGVDLPGWDLRASC
ncbi:protein-L-isoaspartate(D-aspartate) O-methyltransferase [Micromonospora citrea]|uniref:Protein-L-isoaspartate O-methyltransferase n=1 Tax=Micromonospora citrea TaxID=47855 RepID=A0A1C6VWN7_9ACTN|nr:methyltransferase domain-containing protein [Micromonospora citrea]SCL70781.1 protein-L-isoaspartate(D-aspartate) O-methyltransferase [Micromonospora citrea]